MSGQTTKVFGDVQEGELMGDCQTCAICQEDFEEDDTMKIINQCKHGWISSRLLGSLAPKEATVSRVQIVAGRQC